MTHRRPFVIVDGCLRCNLNEDELAVRYAAAMRAEAQALRNMASDFDDIAWFDAAAICREKAAELEEEAAA